MFEFDYHMKLHHSQTLIYMTSSNFLFDYHMKLHHSQTKIKASLSEIMV